MDTSHWEPPEYSFSEAGMDTMGTVWTLIPELLLDWVGFLNRLTWWVLYLSPKSIIPSKTDHFSLWEPFLLVYECLQYLDHGLHLVSLAL